MTTWLWWNRRLRGNKQLVTNYTRILYLILLRNRCFGHLLELPHRGNSNKYPKHMFCEETRTKQDLSYISICSFSILSIQQQTHFNGNVFGNKYCHYNEDSLYFLDEKASYLQLVLYPATLQGIHESLVTKWLGCASWSEPLLFTNALKPLCCMMWPIFFFTQESSRLQLNHLNNFILFHIIKHVFYDNGQEEDS